MGERQLVAGHAPFIDFLLVGEGDPIPVDGPLVLDVRHLRLRAPRKRGLIDLEGAARIEGPVEASRVVAQMLRGKSGTTRCRSSFETVVDHVPTRSALGSEVLGPFGSPCDVVHAVSSELDDVGLVGAIRERLSEAHTPYDRGIEIELDAPDDLPSLSPAVELAAYRITNEALANVFRHADGGSCVIRITAGNELEITVCNDGTPPSSWTAGVGLSSIVDRAEEVGGNATVGPTDEGWTVVAHLPLDRRSASVRP